MICCPPRDLTVPALATLRPTGFMQGEYDPRTPECAWLRGKLEIFFMSQPPTIPGARGVLSNKALSVENLGVV